MRCCDAGLRSSNYRGSSRICLFPSPMDVARGFAKSLRTGRLLDDIVCLFVPSRDSDWRFVTGIPVGLWRGSLSHAPARLFCASITFVFRKSSLRSRGSPLPFCWFRALKRSTPTVFLIFMASFFPPSCWRRSRPWPNSPLGLFSRLPATMASVVPKC